MMQIEKGKDRFNHKKNDNQHGRNSIINKRKIVKKQNQVDKMFSFNKYIPILQKKPDEGQELIPQEKLDAIFLAAKQSLSEDESSSSGSYVMVKESSLIRLKRELFHERVVEGLMKEKINKFKEDLFKKLEQCQNNQQNMDNKQGLDSHQQVISQITSKLEQHRNMNQQDKSSHRQMQLEYRLDTLGYLNDNAQQVLARSDGNIRIVRQQKPILQNQQQNLKKKQGKIPEELKKIQQQRQKQQESETDSQSKKKQTMRKTISKPKKNYKKLKHQYEKRQMHQNYPSDFQREECDHERVKKYNSNYQVCITYNGKKYHKLNCEIANEHRIVREFAIENAKNTELRPCKKCFPLS